MQVIWMTLVMGFMLNSCGKAQLIPGGGSKSKGSATASDTPEISGDDQDAEEAIEPAIVAGAALVCEQAVLPTNPEQSELYCGLNHPKTQSRIVIPTHVSIYRSYLISDTVQLEIFPQKVAGNDSLWRTSISFNLQNYDILVVKMASELNPQWNRIFIAKVAKIPRVSLEASAASAASSAN